MPNLPKPIILPGELGSLKWVWSVIEQAVDGEQSRKGGETRISKQEGGQKAGPEEPAGK